MILQKSTNTYAIPFVMLDSADGITPKTGLTVTVTISKNGGAFAAAGGAVAELSNGWYKYTPTTTDTNTLGTMAIHATATGANATNITVEIVNYDPRNIQNAIWDEALTGATHNVATSAGRRLRTMDSNIILSDVLPSQAGVANNAIKFDGGASTTDGAYDPAMIVILDGAAAGQCRLIYQYDGTNKIAYVDRNWKIQPTTGAAFAIVAHPGREHVNEGLARGGTSNTITLNALASDDNNAYVGQIVFIRSGTGEDQASHITAYNGTTKTATIYKTWAHIPDTTSAYVILPSGMLNIAGMVGDVWENSTRTLTQAAATPYSGISAGDITAMRGDTFSQSLTALGTLANYLAIYWTVKNLETDYDSDAIIQIVKRTAGTSGLIRLNGVAYTTYTDGSIIIDNSSSGNITLNLTAEIMAQLEPGAYFYDVQIIRSSGVIVQTLAAGIIEIAEDTTQTTT